MPTFEPTRTAGGWQLSVDQLLVEIDGAHLDRGKILGTLTVRRGGAILYLNTVNLTSERSRGKVIARLHEKGISLDERALVALDRACRSSPPQPPETMSDGAPDFSGTPRLDLAELTATFRRWLLLPDDTLLPVVTGAFLAHGLASDPVWLLIVAPPGSTKSELLRTLYGYTGVYPLSDLSARTFASGLETHGPDPSLLARLSNEVLILKDLTTVLEKHHDERQAIFAQLREIYDGRFDRVWGTGRELHWEGRLGFLAGVTPVIDKHQGAMSILGERFVLYRPAMPNRLDLAAAALDGAGQEPAMREELSRAMHGFLHARPTEAPDVPPGVKKLLAVAADFVTRARSGVVREGQRRELEYAPEPEAPTRLAKVLLGLTRGIALAYDSAEVGERELRLALRVALDSLPVLRRRVIEALVQGGITGEVGSLTTTKIVGATQYSETAIRRSLEDLTALGVVKRTKGGAGRPDAWELLPEWLEPFALVASESGGPVGVPDKPGDPSHTTTVASSVSRPLHPCGLCRRIPVEVDGMICEACEEDEEEARLSALAAAGA